MKACYDKLLKILIDRKMTKTDLRQQAKISSSTLAKIGKQEMVSSDVLVKICNTLQCDISDIVELVKDENEEFVVQNDPNKLKVVSLFSGAGGMDLGFINSGFEIIWANDFLRMQLIHTERILESILYMEILQRFQVMISQMDRMLLLVDFHVKDFLSQTQSVRWKIRGISCIRKC